jgi:uncharacterized protein YjeT (DUF2065 family)
MNMTIAILWILSLIVEGVVIVLVYHNNVKKFNKIVDNAKNFSEATKAELRLIGIKL